MSSWMRKLASYYKNMRDLYPEDRLTILFDIDGTILDMRYMILYVLKSFDQNHDSHFFETLRLGDITVHENQVEKLLTRLKIPVETMKRVLLWYEAYRWSSEAVLAAHRPFAGVMEVVRWFQMQHNTFVGLNTGRPEFLRERTLLCLNKLGEEYKVHFEDRLLYMNPNTWEEDVANVKAGGVLHFRKAGYRVFAMVDNEPENLDSISRVDPQQEILLLHANTVFLSKRRKLPAGAVSGKLYNITELIEPKALPRHIQFVWHGVNDEANLRHFLSSSIRWAECDLRMDPTGNEVILRHDSFEETPPDEEEGHLFLNDMLNLIKASDKSIKLDLKGNGVLVDKTLELIRVQRIDDRRVWFNCDVELLKEEGFRKLRKVCPSAIIQCPVDVLAPLLLSDPKKARKWVSMFRDWGINRFSIKWRTAHLRKILDQIDICGFEANIYDVPDLESFLKAVLIRPRSITSDFNFPEWHYFGRGSGENHQHYEYSIKKRRQNA